MALVLCTEATATAKLRLLAADISVLKEQRQLPLTKTVWKCLNELQSVVKLIPLRGIDPKGPESSLSPAFKRLVKDANLWVLVSVP